MGGPLHALAVRKGGEVSISIDAQVEILAPHADPVGTVGTGRPVTASRIAPVFLTCGIQELQTLTSNKRDNKGKRPSDKCQEYLKNSKFTMNSVRSLTLFLLASFVESTIPRVREEELRRAVIDHDQHWIAQNLRDVGGKYSAFYISVDDMAFTESSRRLQDLTEEEKECIFGDPSNWMLPLTDGTTRTTFATEVGHYPECARKVMDPMSEGFSSIEILVSNTIERIAGRPLEFSSEDVVVTRLHEAPHKDHIHLYTKSASSVENGTQFMVPFHTDNGIFLIITPTQIQPLQVRFDFDLIMMIKTNGLWFTDPA